MDELKTTADMLKRAQHTLAASLTAPPTKRAKVVRVQRGVQQPQRLLGGNDTTWGSIEGQE